MENLSDIAKLLVNNDRFISVVEENMKIIMKDGKVDSYDIPIIMEIVMDCYNNLGKIKVTYDELPDILQEVVKYIFEKYDIVPDDEEEKFEKMINSIITLIMLKPNIKKKCLKLKSILCKKICN